MSRTKKNPDFTECRVERRCFVRRGKFDLVTGEVKMNATGNEWVVGVCGVPLFQAKHRAVGACRGCLEGFEHPENMPTTRGLAQIATAQVSIERTR